MSMSKLIQAGLLSLSLAAAPAYAATRQVVDVNAHALPPGPPHARHVMVVNSADHPIRHHGVAGAFERLHRWHMRERAKLYKALFVK